MAIDPVIPWLELSRGFLDLAAEIKRRAHPIVRGCRATKFSGLSWDEPALPPRPRRRRRGPADYLTAAARDAPSATRTSSPAPEGSPRILLSVRRGVRARHLRAGLARQPYGTPELVAFSAASQRVAFGPHCS